MLTPGDVPHGRARPILGQRQPALRLAWTRHPERFVHRAPKPRAPPAAVSIDPPDAVLGNHEKTLMDRERRTRSGWMGRLEEMQTGEWTQAKWRLPVAMTVATEHRDHGIVRAVVDSGLAAVRPRSRTRGVPSPHAPSSRPRAGGAVRSRRSGGGTGERD